MITEYSFRTNHDSDRQAERNANCLSKYRDSRAATVVKKIGLICDIDGRTLSPI